MTENKTYNLPQHLVDEWMKGGHQIYVVWLIDLLIMADEAGRISMSISDLSRRWGKHRRAAQNFIALLIDRNMVEHLQMHNQMHKHLYNLTICDYDSYIGGLHKHLHLQQHKQEKEKNKEKEFSPCTPSIEKENKKEKETPSGNAHTRTRERKAFQPPSVDDVYGYCFEKGYTISAEHFVDFYTSKGWMVGKTKMKDWKAAVRNWSRRNTSTYNHHGNNTHTNSSTREERIRNAAALAQYYANTPTDRANTAADF